VGKQTLRSFYAAVRDVPDFPKAGILFRDVTPLMLDAKLFRQAAKQMAEPFRKAGVEKVLGIESRGFILGTAVALELGTGLILARKPGKLPWKKHRVDYKLEYGSDAIEVHIDAIKPGESILIVDDVLATGGTAGAAARVVVHAGGEVIGASFLIELTDLGGRANLPNVDAFSLLRYPIAG